MSIKKLAIAGGVTASLLASTAFASVIDRPFFQVLGVVVVWSGDASNNPVVNDFVLLTPSTGTAGADLIGGAAADGTSVITGALLQVDGTATGVAAGATVDPITGETSGGTFTDGGTSGVLDAADTLTAFGIDATTDVGAGLVGSHSSSFYVASNAAFDIFAQTSNVIATGDFDTAGMNSSNITFDMSIDAASIGAGGDDGLAFGAEAQDPTTGGTGFATINSLADLTTQSKVFDGGRKTAATPGSLAAQSVRFDSVYTLDADTGTAGVQNYDLSMGVGTLAADVTYTVFVP